MKTVSTETLVRTKGRVLLGSLLFVGALALISAWGLRISKWVVNAGGVMTVLALGLLVGLTLVRSRHGGLPSYQPLPLVRPPATLFSLSVFSKMTFGALCGFEFIAILAGECRNPVRTVRRSVMISAPVIAFFYIFGTSSILAFVPSDQINLIGPVPQALTIALRSFGIATILGPIVILLLFTNVFCTGCLTFGAGARLPMVAGWEGIVPAWFTRLHPRYRTPINSILFAAVVTIAACMTALIGVNEEEAFSLIQIWGFTLYGLAYLAMFAIPLIGTQKLRTTAPLSVKVAACSGFVVTSIFVVLSIFPVIDVPNPASYAWKTVAVVVGVNLVGALLFRASRSKTLARQLPHNQS